MRKRYLLLVFAAIFGLSLLAVERYTTELTAPESEVVSDEPDYYGEQLSHRRYGADGKVEQRLQAQASEHFDSSGESHLKSPVVISGNSPEQSWQASADSGVIRDSDTEVRLQGNVLLQSLQQQNPVSISSDSMTYSPDQAIATTNDWVTITNGNSETTSKGLTVDTQRQRLEFKEQVTTRYVQQ